jgi:hypothetical protein
LEHETLLCLDDSTEDKEESFLAKLILVAQSELDRTAARPNIIPYNDMIGWVLEHIDIQIRSVISYQNTSIGSFCLEDIQEMYKLYFAPKYTYNATFILDFERRDNIQYGITGHDIINTWWGNPSKFKSDAHGIYSTTSLNSHI